MRILTIVGCVLVLLGITGLVSGGITYTKDHKTADLGLFGITYEQKETLAIHPAIGAVVLVAGLVVGVASLKRR